jgi:hypothetical protein
MSNDEDDDSDIPFQSHSHTSIEAAKLLDPIKARGQERWVYESLRHESKADWQLWNEILEKGLFPKPFDSESTAGRARIGLVWIYGFKTVMPWHPVEYSGYDIVNPETKKSTQIWRIKKQYWGISYDVWRTNCKHIIQAEKKRLDREKRERKKKKKARKALKNWDYIISLHYSLFKDFL